MSGGLLTLVLAARAANQAETCHLFPLPEWQLEEECSIRSSWHQYCRGMLFIPNFASIVGFIAKYEAYLTLAGQVISFTLRWQAACGYHPRWPLLSLSIMEMVLLVVWHLSRPTESFKSQCRHDKLCKGSWYLFKTVKGLDCRRRREYQSPLLKSCSFCNLDCFWRLWRWRISHP